MVGVGEAQSGPASGHWPFPSPLHDQPSNLKEAFKFKRLDKPGTSHILHMQFHIIYGNVSGQNQVIEALPRMWICMFS